MRRSLAPSQRPLLLPNESSKSSGIKPQCNPKAIAADTDGSTTIKRLPLFGFLSIPESLNKQFKVPSGCVITEKTLELRKVKRLGPPKQFHIVKPGDFGKFRSSSLLQSETSSATEEDNEEEDLPTSKSLPPFEPLVLWSNKYNLGQKIEVIPELASKLRPHQREGVQFLFECAMGLRGFEGEGCILADDMGLGKTLMSITALYTLLNQGFPTVNSEGIPYQTSNSMKGGRKESAVQKVMIVCPTSLIGNWDNELTKWLGDKKCATFVVKSGQEPKKIIKAYLQYNGKCILIISYETQRLYSKLFEQQINKLSPNAGNNSKKNVAVVPPPASSATGEVAVIGQGEETAISNIIPPDERQYAQELLSKHSHNTVCDLLICDEAHKLKNAESGMSKTLALLPVKKKILLSGTPMQNELEEFFNLVNFCNPTVIGTIQEFRRRYERPILASREPSALPSEIAYAQTLQTELSTIVNEFILKRGNILNAQHLPPKLTQVVCCRLTPLQEQLYERLLNSKELRHIEEGKLTNTLGHIRQLIQICSHPQLILETYERKIADKETIDEDLKALVKIIQEHTNAPPPPPTMTVPAMTAGMSRLDQLKARSMQLAAHANHGQSSSKRIDPLLSGKMTVLYRMLQTMRLVYKQERIVIVSNYTSTLDLLQSMCKQNTWPVLRLDGTCSATKRTQLVSEFNNPHSQSFVFLLSSKAGGCGINLIGGNRLVLFDPDWNPASDKQAAGRIWREGQQRHCYIYRFLSTGTIEEKILQRQLQKEGLTEIVDDKECVNSFAVDELKQLFVYTAGANSGRKQNKGWCDTHEMLQCIRCFPQRNKEPKKRGSKGKLDGEGDEEVVKSSGEDEENNTKVNKKKPKKAKSSSGGMKEKEMNSAQRIACQTFLLSILSYFTQESIHYQKRTLGRQQTAPDASSTTGDLGSTMTTVGQIEEILPFAEIVTQLGEEVMNGQYGSLSAYARYQRTVFAAIQADYCPTDPSEVAAVAGSSSNSSSELAADSGRLFPAGYSVYDEFLKQWVKLVPSLFTLTGEGDENGKNEDAEDDEDAEEVLQQVDQMGCPDESDWLSWSHHHSVTTSEDDLLCQSLGDEGTDLISFLFGLEINFSLLQEREIAMKDINAQRKQHQQDELQKLNEKRRKQKDFSTKGIAMDDVEDDIDAVDKGNGQKKPKKKKVVDVEELDDFPIEGDDSPKKKKRGRAKATEKEGNKKAKKETAENNKGKEKEVPIQSKKEVKEKPIELLDSSESEALEHFDDESEANDDQSETFFHDSDNEKDHRTKRKEPQHVTTTLSTTLPISTANVNDIFGADSEEDEQPQMVSDAGDKVKTKPSEIPTVLLSHQEISADTKKKHLSNDIKKDERKELAKPKIEKAVKDTTDKGKEKNKVVEKKEVKANTEIHSKDRSSGSGGKEIVSLLSPVPSKPSESILHTVMKLQELRLSHELDYMFKNDLSFLCKQYATKKLLLPAHSSAAFGSLWKCLKQFNNNWRLLFTSTTASSHLLHALGGTSETEEGRIVDEEMTLYTHIPGCKVEKLSTYRVGIDYFIGSLGLLFYLRKQLAILVQTPKQEQLQPDRLLEVIEQMIAFEESQFVPVTMTITEGPKESIPVEKELSVVKQVPEVLKKQKELEGIRIEKSDEEEELYFQSEPITTTAAVSSRTVVPKKVPTSSIAVDVSLTHKAIKKRSIALESDDEEDFMFEENRNKLEKSDSTSTNTVAIATKVIPSGTTPSVPTVGIPAAKKARHIFDSDEEEDFCDEPPQRTTPPINNPLSECQEGNTMEFPKKSSVYVPTVTSNARAVAAEQDYAEKGKENIDHRNKLVDSAGAEANDNACTVEVGSSSGCGVNIDDQPSVLHGSKRKAMFGNMTDSLYSLTTTVSTTTAKTTITTTLPANQFSSPLSSGPTISCLSTGATTEELVEKSSGKKAQTVTFAEPLASPLPSLSTSTASKDSPMTSSWECSMCTFMNDSISHPSKCAICKNKRTTATRHQMKKILATQAV